MAATFALPSCVAHECTLIGCSSDAELRIDETIDPASVAGATITVCKNEHCASGVFGTANDLPPILDGNGVHADVYFQLHDTTIAGLTVLVGGTSPAPGDTYTVDITLPNGVTATNHSWIVTGILESAPNGDGCGPVCHNAQLQAE